MTTSTGVTGGGRSPVWDLLVVGGGTAGLLAAQTAAGLGAGVVLVERDRTGGECLWTGCVPSKALIAAASSAAQARRAARLGIDVGEVQVDFTAVMAHVQRAVEQIAPVDSPETLRAAGVSVQHGTLRFTGPGFADVDGHEVRFRQAVLATGASPTIPSVPGLSEVQHLTSDTLWDLRELPDRLVILGGGSTGCEIGQAFARLGSRVTLVDRAPRLLSGEDPAAAALVRRAMEDDGMDIRTGRTPVAVRDLGEHRARGSGVLVIDDGAELDFDRLLVAVGRTPRTQGLGLERLGVHVDKDGSPVLDTSLRTSNPRIWAAGDLTTHPGFTHVAGSHGSLAATNAILGLRRHVPHTNDNGHTVPRVTFTQPELAAVGQPTHTPGPGHRLLTWPHDHLDRAVAEGQTDGTTDSSSTAAAGSSGPPSSGPEPARHSASSSWPSAARPPHCAWPPSSTPTPPTTTDPGTPPSPTSAAASPHQPPNAPSAPPSASAVAGSTDTEPSFEGSPLRQHAAACYGRPNLRHSRSSRHCCTRQTLASDVLTSMHTEAPRTSCTSGRPTCVRTELRPERRHAVHAAGCLRGQGTARTLAQREGSTSR